MGKVLDIKSEFIILVEKKCIYLMYETTLIFCELQVSQ